MREVIGSQKPDFVLILYASLLHDTGLVLGATTGSWLQANCSVVLLVLLLVIAVMLSDDVCYVAGYCCCYLAALL